MTAANCNYDSREIITVAAIKSSATVLKGKLGGVEVELMLDSGSSVSLVQSNILQKARNVTQVAARPIELVTASGDQLPILQHVKASVQLGELHVVHEFVVVKNLVAPVILGIDFLQGNGLTLDFTQNPVTVSNRPPPQGTNPSVDTLAIAQVVPIFESYQNCAPQTCPIPTIEEPGIDIIEDCAVPNYSAPSNWKLPTCLLANLQGVINKYCGLFSSRPGYTEDAWHYIPTVGNPVKVPPRRIPAHYRMEVCQQLKTMLDEGFIQRSKSPWMAPAVFVPKKSGQFRICIDYRELNKHTTKDSYPLPLPDEVQDRLAGSTVFSTLDLHSGYWQLPVSIVLQACLTSPEIPHTPMWNKAPFYRWKQLWHQLKVVDGVLCHQYSPSPTNQSVTVPVLPRQLQQDVISCNHDAPTAGHLGAEKTLSRLCLEAFWINMARDVDEYCRQCSTCQRSKLTMASPAPLLNVPIGQPWQMVAVDILQVPLSTKNNRYLLVIQDYFTKWADAIPLPNQTAPRITSELIKFFSVYGPPQILHSDQGCNFESTILAQTLDAFGIRKSHTTPYHPQGDGMVERFNRTLLQLLRAYVTSQHDWELYLPYMLYAYRTSQHASTGASPFLLLYGRNPTPQPLVTQLGYDTLSYPAQIQAKLSELQDFVHSNLTQSAHSQKCHYDQRAKEHTFIPGDSVWLSIPTARKLDP